MSGWRVLGGEVGGSWGGGKVLERQGLGRLRRPPLRPQLKPMRYSVTVVGYHGDITEAGSSGGQERSVVTCREGGLSGGLGPRPLIFTCMKRVLI